MVKVMLTALITILGSTAHAELNLRESAMAILQENYPGSKIELVGEPRLDAERQHIAADQMKLIQDRKDGSAQFALYSVKSPTMVLGKAEVQFRAVKKGLIAARKIRPGETLSEADFMPGEIDISRGMAREYRNLLLSEASAAQKLEAAQTILEGAFATQNAVKRSPDIRRGDQVLIKITSGNLSLSTLGTAQEPSHLGKSVRVMTSSTKKELNGTLMESGTVEVAL